jgi:3-oxoacyl-[acyl-carrier protein] reductase
MVSFAGRVVLITGAARGLGRDYARFFARDGANVVLADIKGLESAVADAAQAGTRCIGIPTDITNRASVTAMVEKTRAEFGRLDVLINNAGLWRRLEEFGLLNCPDDVWSSALAVNVTGTLLCYQAAVPVMKQQGWGRIVNVSSMASVIDSNSYGLTKQTVEHMTSGMAREVGRFGITVNCLAPGICAFEDSKTQLANFDAVVASNAIARVGTTRDLYGALTYLCSEEASWVTGQTLRVDGGALTR